MSDWTMDYFIEYRKYAGGWPHLEYIETVNTNEKLHKSLANRYQVGTIHPKYKNILKRPCLYFTGYTNPKGYGQVNAGGLKMLAHRASYYLFVGDIPKDKLVLHLCDRPWCINPEHLFLGTTQDNTADMMKKNRHRAPGVKGAKNGNAKLNLKLVRQIKKLLMTGLTATKIQDQIPELKEYSKHIIYDVGRGKTWKHITL